MNTALDYNNLKKPQSKRTYAYNTGKSDEPTEPNTSTIIDACFTSLNEAIVQSGNRYAIDTSFQPIKHLDHSHSPATETLTVASMVADIRSVFGVTVAQAAEIVGVSRPSIYNHINQKESPSDLSGYQRAHHLAMECKNLGYSNLKKGLKSVLVKGNTLLTHLKNRNLSDHEFLAIAREVSISVKERTGEAKILRSDTDQLITSRLLSKTD